MMLAFAIAATGLIALAEMAPQPVRQAALDAASPPLQVVGKAAADARSSETDPLLEQTLGEGVALAKELEWQRKAQAAIDAVTPQDAGTPLPRWDVRATCGRQADAIGQSGSAWMMKACLDQEKKAWGKLNAIWADQSEQTRHTCLNQAAAIMDSYWLLHACLQQEMKAAKEIEGFQLDDRG